MLHWPTHVQLTSVLMTILATSLHAQSASVVAKHMAPWGGGDRTSRFQFTTDASWIYMVQSNKGCQSSTVKQRIARMRSDGTDFEVLVDWPVLDTLNFQNNPSIIRHMRMAGDGSTMWFARPRLFDFFHCDPIASSRHYLLDTGTGDIAPFTFNGFDVGNVSFSLDGKWMVFAGWDPDDQEFAYYRSRLDGGELHHILDIEPWYTITGIMSGDGEHFLFISFESGSYGGPGTPGFVNHLWILDIKSGDYLRLTPEPMPYMGTAHVSADGSRVIYGGNDPRDLYAVRGDGTGHRLLASDHIGGYSTLSADGEVVYYLCDEDLQLRRLRWKDGAVLTPPLGEPLGNDWLQHQAIDATGSTFASTLFPPSLRPLHVWSTELPFLTTYGFGTPDSTLHWDVGSHPGDAYVLGWSLALGEADLGPVGVLELGLQGLGVLSVGVVPDDEFDVAGVEVLVPADASLPQPLPVHFQALVTGPEFPGGRLTNRTTFTLPMTAQAAAASAPDGPSSDGPSPDGQAGFPTGGTRGWDLDPEEVTRRLELVDPNVWFKRHGEPPNDAVWERLAEQAAPR